MAIFLLDVKRLEVCIHHFLSYFELIWINGAQIGNLTGPNIFFKCFSMSNSSDFFEIRSDFILQRLTIAYL